MTENAMIHGELLYLSEHCSLEWKEASGRYINVIVEAFYTHGTDGQWFLFLIQAL